MENIIIVSFDIESEGFQAITELKQNVLKDGYAVSQAALVKNTDGHVTSLDSFDTGIETKNDTRMGGLIGALLGVAGGPLGMVLMGGYGALIGSAVDWGDAVNNASLMEHVLSCVTEDSTVLIAVVQEDSEGVFDVNFDKFSAEITRFDAAEVAAEIVEAERVQEEMARQAKRELREAKKQEKVALLKAKLSAPYGADGSGRIKDSDFAASQQAIEERREHIRGRFSDIKAKFSKK